MTEFVCMWVCSKYFVSRGSITAIIARVNCRQCYTAKCVCESFSLVSQDFNSNRGMTL